MKALSKIPVYKRWRFEVDYYGKLNPEEKDFLHKFNKEFIEGNVKKGDQTALHADDESRRQCYANNNQANRDLLSREIVAGYGRGEIPVGDEYQNYEEVIPDAWHKGADEAIDTNYASGSFILASFTYFAMDLSSQLQMSFDF